MINLLQSNHYSAEKIAELLNNDLEKAIIEDYPQIQKLKDTLISADCFNAIMSGSGPTVFGICDREINLELDNNFELFNEGKYEESIKEFEKLLQENPNDFSLLNNIATAYFKIGNFNKAVENYIKSLEVNSNSLEVYQNLAEAYKSCGKILDAILTLQTAASIYPENLDIKYHLSKFYMEDSQYDLAMGELEVILDKEPDHQDAQYDIANIFFEMGLYENAISHFNKVLESVENSADIHFSLAQAYYANDDIDKTLFHLMNVISINPAYYPAYKKLGIIFMAKEEYTEAIEHFEKYLKCDLPEDEKEQINTVIKRIKTNDKSSS